MCNFVIFQVSASLVNRADTLDLLLVYHTATLNRMYVPRDVNLNVLVVEGVDVVSRNDEPLVLLYNKTFIIYFVKIKGLLPTNTFEIFLNF